jgi:hypothetical protein
MSCPRSPLFQCFIVEKEVEVKLQGGLYESVIVKFVNNKEDCALCGGKEL